MGTWTEQLCVRLVSLTCCIYRLDISLAINIVIPSIWIFTGYANVSFRVGKCCKFKCLFPRCCCSVQIMPLRESQETEVFHNLSIIWYLYSFWCFPFIVHNTISLAYIVCNTVCGSFWRLKIAVYTVPLPLLVELEVLLFLIPILWLPILNTKTCWRSDCH